MTISFLLSFRFSSVFVYLFRFTVSFCFLDIITMYVVVCIFYYIMFYMNKNEFALCNSMFKYFSKFPPLQKSVVEEVVGAFFTFEVFRHRSFGVLPQEN